MNTRQVKYLMVDLFHRACFVRRPHQGFMVNSSTYFDFGLLYLSSPLTCFWWKLAKVMSRELENIWLYTHNIRFTFKGKVRKNFWNYTEWKFKVKELNSKLYLTILDWKTNKSNELIKLCYLIYTGDTKYYCFLRNLNLILGHCGLVWKVAFLI